MITPLHLMIDQLYFESGYNGVPWSSTQDPELDIYYYHLNPIPKAMTFVDELKHATQFVTQKYVTAIILDDGSIETQILKFLLPDNRTVPISYSHIPTRNFIDHCQNKYMLNDPEMIFALSLTKHLNAPVLFSRWSFRVINVNAKNQLPPYYVYVENEKYHRLLLAQEDLGISMSWNFLKTTAELFRAYLYHPLMKQWLNKDNNNTPNNYEVERLILYNTLAQIKSRQLPTDIHKQKWPLGPWSQTIQTQLPEQQSSFPLHLVYEKIFNCHSDLNQFARDLYG